MNIIKCKGFLPVGDPHTTARRPGRRCDMNFMRVALDKLEQAINYANEMDLVVTILGDLFHYDREYNVDINNELLIGLMDVLSLAKYTPYCLTGNHDFGNETRLDNNKNMTVIKASRLLHVVENTKGICMLEIDGQLYGIGGSPSGKLIPDSVGGYFPEATVKNFWLTHEDLAFPGSYPGAKVFFEIEDCDTVINGHMHLEQPIHQCGKTRWFNPGNILRMSVDAEVHEPAVWSWTPSDDLVKYTLRYEPEIFNKDDYHVASDNIEDLTHSIRDLFDESAFVKSLMDDDNDANQSQDGLWLRANIDGILKGKTYSKGVETMTLALWNLSIQEQSKAINITDELKKMCALG